MKPNTKTHWHVDDNGQLTAAQSNMFPNMTDEVLLNEVHHWLENAIVLLKPSSRHSTLKAIDEARRRNLDLNPLMRFPRVRR